MLASIIMPAFNRERYIAGAIESVLAQRCSSWELIIVDDGSSDRTPEIAAEYVRANPGKVALIRQSNGGVAAARNAGIRAARGDYIAFIDSDDLWLPNKLQTQFSIVEEHPSVSFVYTGYKFIDADGEIVGTVVPDPEFQGDVTRLLWLKDNQILGPTLLIQRKRLFDVGLFNEELKGAENLDLRIRLARSGPVLFVKEPMYLYRKHPNSLTANVDLMFRQQWRMIVSHFGSEDALDGDSWLRQRVISRYWRSRADMEFGRGAFRTALRMYKKAWLHSDGKMDIFVRSGRCLLGRHGNGAIRVLKRGAGGSTARRRG